MQVWSTCFVSFFRVFGHTREFFTHLETSPLPVKGYKFWHKPAIHGLWAVRVLYSATPNLTQANLLWWSSPRTLSTKNLSGFGSDKGFLKNVFPGHVLLFFSSLTKGSLYMSYKNNIFLLKLLNHLYWIDIC